MSNSGTAKLIKLSNNKAIPCVGLGTYLVSPAAEIVYQACKRGYRHFDSAVLYNNEAEVGQGLLRWLSEDHSRKRADLFYTTKLWNSQCGYAKAKQAIRQCLQEVDGLGYIDLLLIHSPLCGPASRLETWKAMQEAVDEGLVKSIGVSNYGIKHLQELLQWPGLKYPPVVNQIEISPWLMRQEIVKFCHENNIHVEAYAPLTHGYKLTHPPPEVRKLMDKYSVSSAQVLIKWSLQKGLIPLPKTKSAERLEPNIDVFGFELTPEEVQSLDHPDAYEPTDWECTDAP